MSAITRKNHQKLHNELAAGGATPVATDPDKTQEDPSTAVSGPLADEFAAGPASASDCCTCDKCPCHDEVKE